MPSTEELWEDLRGELEGSIRRRVRDEHLAADLLQETFVRIHDGLGGVREDEAIRPWVYRVARSVVADHFRRARPSAPLAADVPDAAAPGSPGAGTPDNLNAEVDRWLAGMLDALPPEYRDAVRMAELEGLTQRELAERLGLSLSGAKSRVQRGRELLKGMLLACCHLDFDRRGNVVDYQRRGGCSHCCAGQRSGDGCS